jgi:hypothetical protein
VPTLARRYFLLYIGSKPRLKKLPSHFTALPHNFLNNYCGQRPSLRLDPSDDESCPATFLLEYGSCQPDLVAATFLVPSFVYQKYMLNRHLKYFIELKLVGTMLWIGVTQSG